MIYKTHMRFIAIEWNTQKWYNIIKLLRGDIMPYNFNTKQNYEFDFLKCTHSLTINQYLNKYPDYINNWNKIFISLDRKDYIKNTKDNFFQYEYIISDTPYYIHFNISSIFKNINYLKTKIEQVDINSFGMEPGKILYSQTKYLDYHKTSLEPIIIVPLPAPYSDYVVIDGNHRISAKRNIKCNISSLFTIPDKSFCFLQEIDRAIYLFSNEVFSFSNYLAKGISFNQLLQISYINTEFNHLL